MGEVRRKSASSGVGRKSALTDNVSAKSDLIVDNLEQTKNTTARRALGTEELESSATSSIVGASVKKKGLDSLEVGADAEELTGARGGAGAVVGAVGDAAGTAKTAWNILDQDEDDASPDIQGPTGRSGRTLQRALRGARGRSKASPSAGKGSKAGGKAAKNRALGKRGNIEVTQRAGKTTRTAKKAAGKTGISTAGKTSRKADAAKGAAEATRQAVKTTTRAAGKTVTAVATGGVAPVLGILAVVAVVLMLMMAVSLTTCSTATYVAVEQQNGGGGGGGTDIVAVAKAEYERGEEDGTHNYGGSKYYNWNGRPDAVGLWCVCFVMWCGNECGYVDSGLFPPKGCAAVLSFHAYFQENGDKGTIHRNDGMYKPQPGDLAIHEGGDGQHIGIVAETTETSIVKVYEGNSGDKTSYNAYALGNKYWNYFITPNYPASGETALGEGVDFSIGEAAFISLWGAKIDKYYANYQIKAGQTVPLAGHGEDFARSAYRHKFDPRLSPAIAVHESGGGRVCWLKYGPYDAWGWGASFPEDNWPDAIEHHLRGLEKGYSGMTLKEIVYKYAPPNENDTEGYLRFLQDALNEISSY